MTGVRALVSGVGSGEPSSGDARPRAPPPHPLCCAFPLKDRGMQKIFCIGFNKSGTTTLHLTFIRLGFASIHGDIVMEGIPKEHFSPAPSEALVHRRIAEVARQGEWSAGDLGCLQDVYDCYSDGENHDFERLHASHPEARFILNTRRLDQWVASRIKHISLTRKNADQVKHHEACPLASPGVDLQRRREDHETCTAYMDPCPYDSSDGAIKRWILRRNAYHRRVLEHFRASPNFQVLCIGDDGVPERLSELLGRPVLTDEIHANRGRRDFGFNTRRTRRRLRRIGVEERHFGCSTASDELERSLLSS